MYPILVKAHKTSFSCRITKLSSHETDKLVSLAGLEKLTPLLPKSINLKDSPDIIGCVLNAAVGNYSNKNGDSVTNKTLADIAQRFVWKFVNASHNRQKVIGVICNYGFSIFGSNELIEQTQAEQEKGPVNLSLAILLWKPTLSSDFIELLESAADESSPDFGAISASWELWFDDYDIAVSPSKSVADAAIISDDKKKDYENYLMAKGGNGRTQDGNYVFRVIKEDSENEIVPVGIGLVEYPAASVKGLEIVNPETDTEEDEDDDEDEKEEELEVAANTNTIEVIESDITTNVITDPKDLDYTTEIKEYLNDIFSKHKKISVSNDNMKDKYKFLEGVAADKQEAIASAIHDMVADRIKEAATEYETKLKADKEALQAAEAEIAELKSGVQAKEDLVSKLQAAVTELESSLEALTEKVTSHAREEKYAERMSFYDQNFDLSDEKVRSLVAKKLKNLDTDEAFAEVKEELELFLKPKSAPAPTIEEPKTDALQTALASATPENTAIPNTAPAEEPNDYRSLAKRVFQKKDTK